MKIASIRLAIATWIAPAGTAVIPPARSTAMPRPPVARTPQRAPGMTLAEREATTTIPNMIRVQMPPKYPKYRIGARYDAKGDLVAIGLGGCHTEFDMVATGGGGGAYTKGGEIPVTVRTGGDTTVPGTIRYSEYLEVTQCRDPSMWYAEHIGGLFPNLGHIDGDWRTRDASGFLNVVRIADAKPIKIKQAPDHTEKVDPHAYNTQAANKLNHP